MGKLKYNKMVLLNDMKKYIIICILLLVCLAMSIAGVGDVFGFLFILLHSIYVQ